MMKLISLLLATLIALTSVAADAAIKKKNKRIVKKNTQLQGSSVPIINVEA